MSPRHLYTREQIKRRMVLDLFTTTPLAGDAEIGRAAGVSESTVSRIRKRVNDGWSREEIILGHKRGPRPGRRALDRLRQIFVSHPFSKTNHLVEWLNSSTAWAEAFQSAGILGTDQAVDASGVDADIRERIKNCNRRWCIQFKRHHDQDILAKPWKLED
jgi:hypothetical protein